MSLFRIILAFILNLFLIISNEAFAAKSCDIYLVETDMDYGDKIVHQGLRFADGKGEVECHFTPKGLQICDKDCYITRENKEAKYRRVKGIAKNHPSSKKDLVQWCKNWAEGRIYSTPGYNCWKMVGDFCESHNIRCPATEDRNAVLDALVVGGASRACADGISALKDRDVLGAALHIANAPLRGVVEGLDSTLKCFGKILK